MSKKQTKEYHLNYQYVTYWKRKEKYIALLGGKCSVCGNTDGLEFDHVDPTTKTITATRLFSKYSEKRIEQELDKCQLLCKICHKIKSSAETSARPSPKKGKGKKHGSYYGVYSLKCRCLECSEYRDNRLSRQRSLP